MNTNQLRKIFEAVQVFVRSDSLFVPTPDGNCRRALLLCIVHSIEDSLARVFGVENGQTVANRFAAEVMIMFAAVWLMLSSLLYSLQLQTGSFPKPLTAEEEWHYLALAAQGDPEARNILIHIMKKY